MSTQYTIGSKDSNSNRRPTYPFDIPAGYKVLPMTQVQAYGVDPSAAFALVPVSTKEEPKPSRRRGSTTETTDRRGESRREPTRNQDALPRPRPKHSDHDRRTNEQRLRRDDTTSTSRPTHRDRDDRNHHHNSKSPSPPRSSKHDIAYRHVDRHEVGPRRSYERDDERYESQQPVGILRKKRDGEVARPSPRALERRRSSYPTEKPRRLYHRSGSPSEKHVHWA